jgi:hypothetical protein
LKTVGKIITDPRVGGAVAIIAAVVGVLTFAFGDNVLGDDPDGPKPSPTLRTGPDDGPLSPSPLVTSPTGPTPSETATEESPEPPTPPPSPNSGSGKVVFKDRFKLATSEGVNLDAGTTKIQNGVSITDGDGMDIYVDGWANGHLKAAPTPDGQGRFFKSRSGTLADCMSLIERGEGSDTSAVPETTTGLWYCFLTSEGRVAAARIGGRADRVVPVSATVWDRMLHP